MHKILTVTPNPALDVSAHTPQVQPVHKLRCDAVERHPGGGGVNVARVLHRLGEDVCAIYTSGGTTGSLMTDLLRQEGVRCDPMQIGGHTRESFTVHDHYSGQEYRFVLPGPPMSDSDSAQLIARVLAHQQVTEYVVASGSLVPGLDTGWYARLIAALRHTKARVIVDTSGAPLRAALDAGVLMIKPSLREMRELTGLPLPTWAELVPAAQQLVQTERLEILVVSLGEMGALMCTRDECLYAPPIKVDVRSAVGAGDSFVGGMVWALSAGKNAREAFTAAVACGTAALSSVGTGLCAYEDVQRMLPQVVVQAPPHSGIL